MKIISSMIYFTIALAMCSVAQGEDICKLKFAPLPMEKRETIVKQFKPMFYYLHKQTGCEIEFEYSDNYSEILEKIKSGKVDLAYLGPLPYVTLTKEYKEASPLVYFKEPSGEPKYTCCVIENENDPINIEKSKKLKIALTQPLSTCGYLSTNGLLREKGNSLNRNLYRYLDRHDDVALAVARGEYDAGGLKTAIAKRYTHLGLKIIDETDPLPGFALVINQRTVSKEITNKILEALVSLDPTGKDAETVSSWGANIKFGVTTANDNDYDVVRKLLGHDALPETGNF